MGNLWLDDEAGENGVKISSSVIILKNGFTKLTGYCRLCNTMAVFSSKDTRDYTCRYSDIHLSYMCSFSLLPVDIKCGTG